MTVNELARAAGVPAGRARYHARRGLLPAGRHTNNDYRRFAPQALAWLRFIAAARALGFALADVAGQRACRAGDADRFAGHGTGRPARCVRGAVMASRPGDAGVRTSWARAALIPGGPATLERRAADSCTLPVRHHEMIGNE